MIMSNTSRQLRNRLEQIKGQKAAIKAQIRAEKNRLAALLRENDINTQAQLILQEGARLTQEHLQYRISTLVTLAMEAVFDNPYNVQLIFEPARGKTTATIQFERDGELVDPCDATGGGAIDTASLGLMFSLWTLQTPRARNLFILDEPLKWLKGSSLPEKGAKMLSEISHRLGLQIIMVSHAPELIEHADKVFEVTKKRNISVVKTPK